MSLTRDVIEIRLERLDDEALAPVFGLFRITGSGYSEGSFALGQEVLAPAARTVSGHIEVDARCCIPIPERMPADRAMAVPRLAVALAICETVTLELGDLPICTTGTNNLQIIATVCRWRTGREVLVLDLHDGPVAAGLGHRRIDGMDPQRAIDEITRASASVPGLASIVLSRKSEAVDILLEAMPMWARMIIASQGTESATIDFYNNVHRKGANLVTGPASPAFLFEPRANADLLPLIERAVRILRCDELAESLFAPRP